MQILIGMSFLKGASEELCRRLELHVQSFLPQLSLGSHVMEQRSLDRCRRKAEHGIGKKDRRKKQPCSVWDIDYRCGGIRGRNRSRVRLITDERLVPSVRAIRGREQTAF